MDQSLDLPLPVLALSGKRLSGQHLLDFFLCFCKGSGLYCAWNQEADGREAGRNFIFLRKLQRCLLCKE